MSDRSRSSPFSDFDPCGGQFDQRLEENRGWALPAMSMPERFPAFMSFPVITSIEQPVASEIGR
jgi:hypothetical protein